MYSSYIQVYSRCLNTLETFLLQLILLFPCICDRSVVSFTADCECYSKLILQNKLYKLKVSLKLMPTIHNAKWWPIREKRFYTNNGPFITASAWFALQKLYGAKTHETPLTSILNKVQTNTHLVLIPRLVVETKFTDSDCKEFCNCQCLYSTDVETGFPLQELQGQ